MRLATYDPKSPAAFSGSEQSGLLAASQLLEAPSLGASPQNKLTTFFGLWNHPFQVFPNSLQLKVTLKTSMK